MPRVFSRKAFSHLLWAVPPLALCAFTANHVFRDAHPAPPAAPQPPVKVPIEVITSGSEKTKTIYVELESQTIPEPSALLLVPLSAALIFRRKR